MKLHVLTAVSRPDNLPQIAESLATAALNAPNIDVCWHWRFDTAREHVGGQTLKNSMLDEIDDGWIYVLDDDTLMHPDLLARIYPHRLGFEAIVVSQQRTSGAVLHATPENVCVGGIDIGQAVIHNRYISGCRLAADYNADGMWLKAVLSDQAIRVLYLDEILSSHNVLSGVEVSV